MKFKKNNIKVYLFKFKKNIFDLIIFYNLVRLISKIKPDLVQTWMYHADIIGSIATKISSKAPIYWNLRHGDNISSKFYNPVILICIFLSNFFPKKIVSCSLTSSKYHADLGYPSDKFHFIPNGFDLSYFSHNQLLRERFRRRYGLTHDDYLVGMPARFHAQKDHETFIKASAEVIKKIPNCFFILCGSDISNKNKSLINLLRKYNLERYFFLLGKRNDMNAIYSSIDVCCLTSSYGEAFPNILAEAMATKVPCISTKVGDAKFILGEKGYIIPVKSYKKLAFYIVRLLSMNSNQKLYFGNQCRDRILKNFSIDQFIREYEDLYLKELS